MKRKRSYFQEFNDIELPEPEPVIEEKKVEIIPPRDIRNELEAIASIIRNLASKGIRGRNEQADVVRSQFPEFYLSGITGYTVYKGITRFQYNGLKKNVY